MGTILTTLIIALAVALVLVFWTVGAYNRLVGMRQAGRTAFVQVAGQVQRRHELVPTLVEAAKTYLKQERDTLEAVIEARNDAVAADAGVAGDPADTATVQRMSGSEAALTAAIRRLSDLAQDNPEMQADDHVRQLREDLASTEHRIAFARQAYNDTVARYNGALRQFPVVIVARLFGFRLAEPMAGEDTPVDRRQGRA